MSVVEQAAKRLEELSRAGVAIPWAAAGLADSDLQARLGKAADARPAAPDRASRIPATVEVDLSKLQEAGYLVPHQAQTAIADEFRHVKRALLWNAARDEGPERPSNRLLMVTSALPGEGKTFCSINLAMSIAMEVDQSVVLVDADVMRPSVFARLGLHARRGLLDLLAEPQLEVGDVLLGTNVPKLSLLHTGTLLESANELLASSTMERLLAELVAQDPDRIVIFDAPPLLLSAGAVTLASRMGQVAVVVEASVTPRQAVTQAFEAVARCPNVMAVLNKCAKATDGAAYGYYERAATEPPARSGAARRWGGWLRQVQRRG